MKLTPVAIIESLEADSKYLFDPLFSYWQENEVRVYTYFGILAIMLNQVMFQ